MKVSAKCICILEHQTYLGSMHLFGSLIPPAVKGGLGRAASLYWVRSCYREGAPDTRRATEQDRVSGEQIYREVSARGYRESSLERWRRGVNQQRCEKTIWLHTGDALLSSLPRKIKIIEWFTCTSLVAQLVKNPPGVQETLVRFLGREDPLEKGWATHSSILAWRTPMDRGAS